MIYLLDTNAFLFWNTDANRLSTKAYEICEDEDNILYLSLASVWEMQIKEQLGKLAFPTPLRDMLAQLEADRLFEILPIRREHIWAIHHFPFHHRDPFDRMLIAQAQVENIPIVSADSIFKQYAISVIW